MRFSTPGLACAALAAFALAACGGGGGSGPPLGSSSSSSGGGTNTAPTAHAGTNQSVAAGVAVTLNGTASTDPDGTIASYAWTQTSGAPAIMLTGPATAQPTFTAPTVATATAFAFSLMVTDNLGATSTAATVTVTVNPPVAGNVNVTGTVTFARVLFQAATNRGLDYANQQQRPARGVLVRATYGANSVTDTTSDNGNYSLSVPANTNITIAVVAQMQRTGALPNWNVTVRDGVAGNLYTYTEPASFSSGAGTAHDVAIPSGIAANGTASGERPSGPFAILDTIFKAQTLIRSVEPTVNFPPLIVDWGTQELGTFFSSSPSQHIALLADLTEDTDEFDEHVIAHEFGHYIEFNFSRADNIGGSHALGNRLDPRTAFGEGFGYAFAAMVLDDPGARDSFVSNVCAPSNQCAGYFDIQRNPGQFIGTAGDNTGCWCSESSVWSILWDVFDSDTEVNDTVNLGFAPIWSVLTNAQRTTPALTTIFSFVTALKAVPGAPTAAVNTLVAAQNINASNIDAFGSTETNSPAEVASNAALPVFRSVPVPTGAPAIAFSVNDGATNQKSYNKLGSHRFLRFTLAGTQMRTITVTSPNPNTPDPDFSLYRNGVRQGNAAVGQPLPGQGPPATTESFPFNLPAGDYVLDVYECANGCDDDDGTEGDYNLSVTIN